LKILLFLIFTFYNYQLVAQDVIRFVDSKKYPDPKQSYFIDLLTLALETSKEKYGDYTLQGVAIEMAQARTSIMLERNDFIDLTWRMTSRNLEQHLQAIYFPLLRGMMGNRIFIIRKSDQQFFHKNMPIQELKLIPLGQGYNWPDTGILIYNGFNVVKGYDNYLLKMLLKNRFDYFPRALHEPWLEIENHPDLIVEKHLMFKYPAPIFYFVNKDNKRLAERLNYGLKRLLDSGKFEQLFLTHAITQGILKKAQISDRTIYNLKNPLLSVKTQSLLEDPRLWISFNQR